MTRPAADDSAISPLMEYILAVLAPLLIVGSITDLGLARLAAREAIDAYKARNSEELLTIAQIAGFAIAALDNLRLSATADLSVSLKLKLRGNAAALNRAGQKNTAELWALRREPPPTHAPEQEARAREAARQAVEDARVSVRHAEAQLAPAQLAPAQLTAAKSPADRRDALAWAGAMTEVAAECCASLDSLPANRRRAEMARINVLTEVARDISKAGLMGSTSLTGGLTADQAARLRDSSAIPSSAAATKPTIAVARA